MVKTQAIKKLHYSEEDLDRWNTAKESSHIQSYGKYHVHLSDLTETNSHVVSRCQLNWHLTCNNSRLPFVKQIRTRPFYLFFSLFSFFSNKKSFITITKKQKQKKSTLDGCFGYLWLVEIASQIPISVGNFHSFSPPTQKDRQRE